MKTIFATSASFISSFQSCAGEVRWLEWLNEYASGAPIQPLPWIIADGWESSSLWNSPTFAKGNYILDLPGIEPLLGEYVVAG